MRLERAAQSQSLSREYSQHRAGSTCKNENTCFSRECAGQGWSHRHEVWRVVRRRYASFEVARNRVHRATYRPEAIRLEAHGQGAEAPRELRLNGHEQGEVPHFGHLLLYFLSAASSRSMPRTFAREAVQAITSANSSSTFSLHILVSASPSSFTSSTNHS